MVLIVDSSKVCMYYIVHGCVDSHKNLGPDGFVSVSINFVPSGLLLIRRAKHMFEC